MVASGDSNRIWMGAQPGIIEFNQATNIAKHITLLNWKNRTVRQVAEDRDGNLLAGHAEFWFI